jgi:hypothetical protein
MDPQHRKAVLSADDDAFSMRRIRRLTLAAAKRANSSSTGRNKTRPSARRAPSDSTKTEARSSPCRACRAGQEHSPDTRRNHANSVRPDSTSPRLKFRFVCPVQKGPTRQIQVVRTAKPALWDGLMVTRNPNQRRAGIVVNSAQRAEALPRAVLSASRAALESECWPTRAVINAQKATTVGPKMYPLQSASRVRRANINLRRGRRRANIVHRAKPRTKLVRGTAQIVQ